MNVSNPPNDMQIVVHKPMPNASRAGAGERKESLDDGGPAPSASMISNSTAVPAPSASMVST